MADSSKNTGYDDQDDLINLGPVDDTRARRNIKKESESYSGMPDKAKKTKLEGKRVECPVCGEYNTDLPFMTGEKCINCGYRFETASGQPAAHRSILKESEQDYVKQREQEYLRDLTDALDLPDKVKSIPDLEFSYSFNSYAWAIHLFYLLFLTAGGYSVYLWLTIRNPDYELILLTTVIFVYFLFKGFSGLIESLSAVHITVNQQYMVIQRAYASECILYKSIKDIDCTITRRSLGGGGMLFPYFGRDSSYHASGFTFGKARLVSDTFDEGQSGKVIYEVVISTEDRPICFTWNSSLSPAFKKAFATIVYMTQRDGIRDARFHLLC